MRGVAEEVELGEELRALIAPAPEVIGAEAVDREPEEGEALLLRVRERLHAHVVRDLSGLTGWVAVKRVAEHEVVAADRAERHAVPQNLRPRPREVSVRIPGRRRRHAERPRERSEENGRRFDPSEHSFTIRRRLEGNAWTKASARQVLAAAHGAARWILSSLA